MRIIYELILINRKGQILARALELNSEDHARGFANQWNRDRNNHPGEDRWVVSRIERGIT